MQKKPKGSWPRTVVVSAFRNFPSVITPGVYDPSETLGKLNLPKTWPVFACSHSGPPSAIFAKALSDRRAAELFETVVPLR
jgi:hypothetical protein